MPTPRSLLAVVTAVVLVTGIGDASATQNRQGATRGVESATRTIHERLERTATGIGTTVTEMAKAADKRLKQAGKEGKRVGDRLYARAKGFGEALWDGATYAGRTAYHFFTRPK